MPSKKPKSGLSELFEAPSALDLGRLLFFAAEDADLSRVVSLLKQDADARAESETESGSHTPLTIVLRSGKPEAAACAEALLPHSDPNAFTLSGHNALISCIIGGNLECLRVVLPWVDARKKTKALSTALHCAAWEGHPEMVKELIPVSDLNQKDGQGRSALEIAVSRDCLDSVRALIKAGSDPNSFAPGQRPLLMQAIQQNDLAVIEALLEAGADPKAGDDDGNCPLMFAAGKAWESSLEMIQLLLPVSDPFAVNAFGLDALMMFCGSTLRNEASEAQKALILAQACGLSHRGKSGMSAIEIASLSGKVTAARALQDYQLALEEKEALKSVAPEALELNEERFKSAQSLRALRL